MPSGEAVRGQRRIGAEISIKDIHTRDQRMTIDIARRRLVGGAMAMALSGAIRVASAQSRKPVKFLFDVLPNPKHALFYPALKLGYLAEQGLDVTIESSKGSADAIQNVASGAAAFGFADASAVVLAR